MSLIRRTCLLFFCMVSVWNAAATHLRSGYISLKLKGGLTYSVTIRVFTNTQSEIRFGGGILDFGDGSSPYHSPIIENTPTQYPDVGVVNFTITHTFPSNGTYVISYVEPNLSAGIINIDNSITKPFYLESGFSLEEGKDCSSPNFIVDQFFKQRAGGVFTFSNQAVDKNDNKLTYEMVIPLAPLDLLVETGVSVYSQPHNLSINNYSGLVTWDTNMAGFVTGEYLFAVRVSQIDAHGKQAGYITRTFMIELEDTNSDLTAATSIIEPNNKVYVAIGSNRTVRAIVSDNSQADEVRWDVYLDDKIADHAVFTQYDSVAGPAKIKVGILTLSSDASIVRDNPYSITLRGTSIKATEAHSTDISYIFFTKDVELPVIITETKAVPAQTVKAYPNPFLRYFYIDVEPEDRELQLRLIDTSGRIALSTTTTANKPIDGSDLPSGLYIVELRNGLTTERQKVIKR
jgi:hypothetical protein